MDPEARKDRMKKLATDFNYIGDALRTLDEIMSMPNCHNCGVRNRCRYEPKWGDVIRYNCPLWEAPEGVIAIGRAIEEDY